MAAWNRLIGRMESPNSPLGIALIGYLHPHSNNHSKKYSKKCSNNYCNTMQQQQQHHQFMQPCRVSCWRSWSWRSEALKVVHILSCGTGSFAEWRAASPADVVDTRVSVSRASMFTFIRHLVHVFHEKYPEARHWQARSRAKWYVEARSWQGLLGCV